MGNKLIDKILKNSETATLLKDAKVLTEKDNIPTAIPALNIILSGDVNRGYNPGVTQFAGPSKHFKSMFALTCAKAYLEKYPDAVMILYDNEFGAPITYFDSLGIDGDRVVHDTIETIEELKHKMMQQLDNIERGDHVCIVVDSIGNLASNKEIDDALNDKNVADMTRAKQLKSLFRIVTPKVVIRDIPMIVVNHSYKAMEMYARDVVSGGTGSYYSSETIIMVGRNQEKETSGDKDLIGYNFVLRAEKSRFVKENEKIEVKVLFDGGVYKYSGLLDVAVEGNFIVKPKKGFYSLPDSDKEYKEKDTGEILEPLLKDQKFLDYITTKYKIANSRVL